MNQPQTITFPGHPTPVALSDIRYLQGAGGNGCYTIVYLVSRPPIVAIRNLGRYQKSLPGFLRVHKQTLINPAHLQTARFWCTPNGLVAGEVQLSGDKTLPVSRRKGREVRKYLATVKP